MALSEGQRSLDEHDPEPKHIPLSFTPQLTLLVSVALCRAIRAIVPVEAGIKWPNDLLIGGRKAAGILLESSAENETLQHIIAGVGIGVNLEPDDYPPELRNVLHRSLSRPDTGLTEWSCFAAFCWNGSSCMPCTMSRDLPYKASLGGTVSIAS